MLLYAFLDLFPQNVIDVETTNFSCTYGTMFLFWHFNLFGPISMEVPLCLIRLLARNCHQEAFGILTFLQLPSYPDTDLKDSSIDYYTSRPPLFEG